MSIRWAILASIGLALGVAPAATAFANGHEEAAQRELGAAGP
jgi:hypothetical protein